VKLHGETGVTELCTPTASSSVSPVRLLNLSIPNASIPNLPQTLRALLAQIPPGRVTTYGDLARALGDIAAARWIGEHLVNHRHDDACVCHRVVRSTGDVGLSITGDSADKISRLQAERVAVARGRVDLQRFGFSHFRSSAPLKPLQELQLALPEQFLAEPLEDLPPVVGGVDVSYGNNEAAAACVRVETATGTLLDSCVVHRPAEFPYIPGYLSFRELPALLQLLDTASRNGELPEVLFVDGNGILHPRGAGIATHFGVVTGRRTIGIGKKLLCGEVDANGLSPAEWRPVHFNGNVVGAAVRATSRSRPIFVSPGHRMTVDDAVRLTRHLFHGHRLPEPLYLADRLSRQRAQSPSN